MGDFRPYGKDWLQLALLTAALVVVVVMLDRFIGRIAALLVGVPVGLFLAVVLFLFLVMGPQPPSSKDQENGERRKGDP